MDVEDWVTGLGEGDEVPLRVGECDPPHAVEAGFEDFSVEGVDRVDVVVLKVNGWQEGELSSGAYVLTVEFTDEGVAEEMDAIATGGTLRWQGDHNQFDLMLEVPAVQSMGAMTSAQVEVWPGVPEEMRPYREEAISEAKSLRSDGVRRVIYSDAVVRYVADERGVDVARLEATDLGEILDEYGVRMFPREFDVIDVSERTLADVLSALRYFRCS
jgi:hypothetical protein